MRKSPVLLTLLILLSSGMVLTNGGCKKKVTPPPMTTAPPPPPPPPARVVPAPAIQISASPNTIARGQSATISWNSSNATSVSIDVGIGTVEGAGSRTVSPANSTTYTATATNSEGRSASSGARVTVTEPAPTPPPVRTISDREYFDTRVQDIQFDYDKYNIRDDARDTLDGNGRALNERSQLRFTIEGHCDERGSEKYNLALGDRRATTTKEYLVSKGISADRIDTISYGEEKPMDSSHSEEAWTKNRRAHFVLK